MKFSRCDKKKKDHSETPKKLQCSTQEVEAMCYQVQVNSDDADGLRFLWLENVNSDEKPDTYQMLMPIFGGQYSPSCGNYAVTRTA